MKSVFLLSAVALMCVFARVAAAEPPRAEACIEESAPKAMMTPAAWSRPVETDTSVNWAPAAFRGLSCERCSPQRHYCVVNPLRYEYACAPLGTVACISTERTAWCPQGRSCWAGRCQ